MKRLRYMFTGAGALAVASVIGKLLGALYRIPLTNVLGGEGMGLYQMVFPLYTLLLTVSGGGLPVAISTLVAKRRVRGDEKGAKKVLFVSAAALSVVGLFFAVVLVLFSRPLAVLQGNAGARLAYFGIAPAVFFVAVLSCIRGYYQGRENMLPTAVSQLTEQVAKLGFGLTFASLLSHRGVEYAVLGALLGVSISEALATFILCGWFLLTERRLRRLDAVAGKRVAAFSASADHGLDSAEGKEARFRRTPVVRKRREAARRRDERDGLKRERARELVSYGFAAENVLVSTAHRHVQTDDSALGILKSIFTVALPVTFGSLVLPVTQVVDSLLIINLLSRTSSVKAATGAYGLLSGTVTTLINMPTVVISAFSVALLPKIARLYAQKEGIESESGFAFRLCLSLGTAMALFTYAYSTPIVNLLYSGGLSVSQRTECASLLRTFSPTVPFVSVIQVSTAVLQGVGKPKKPAKNLLLGSGLKLILTAALLPLIGIYGAVVGSVGCYALTAVLDAVEARREVRSVGGKHPFSLAIASAAMLAIGLVSVRLTSSVLLLLVSAGIGVAAFFAILGAFGWFSRKEIMRILPFFKH